MFRVFCHHPRTNELCGVTSASDYVTASIFARHMRRLGWEAGLLPETPALARQYDTITYELSGKALCKPGEAIRTDLPIPTPDACEGR